MVNWSEVVECLIIHLKLVGNFWEFNLSYSVHINSYYFKKDRVTLLQKVLLYFTTRTRTVHSLPGKITHLKLVGYFREFGQRFLFVNKLLSVQVPEPLAVESDLKSMLKNFFLHR
jgi:hypothetical protein